MSHIHMKSIMEFGTRSYAFHVDTWLSNLQAYGIVELAKVMQDQNVQNAIMEVILAKLNCHDDEAAAIPSAIAALAADLEAQGWK
jgi:hypothetical protein